MFLILTRRYTLCDDRDGDIDDDDGIWGEDGRDSDDDDDEGGEYDVANIDDDDDALANEWPGSDAAQDASADIGVFGGQPNLRRDVRAGLLLHHRFGSYTWNYIRIFFF